MLEATHLEYHTRHQKPHVNATRIAAWLRSSALKSTLSSGSFYVFGLPLHKAKIPLVRNANANDECECDKQSKTQNQHRNVSICVTANTKYDDDKMNPFLINRCECDCLSDQKSLHMHGCHRVAHASHRGKLHWSLNILCYSYSSSYSHYGQVESQLYSCV